MMKRRREHALVVSLIGSSCALILGVASCVGDSSNTIVTSNDASAADQIAPSDVDVADVASNDASTLDAGGDAGNCGGGCDGAVCFEGVCGGNEIEQVSAGKEAACALTLSGSVYCWGSNPQNELGGSAVGSQCTDFAATTSCTATPTRVAGLDNISQVSMGDGNACAIRKTDNAVLCWGANDEGQLGHDPGTAGDTTCSSRACNGVPQVVAGLTDALEVHAGDGWACGRTSGATVKCWGRNDLGNLGQGTVSVPAYSSSPLEISTLSGVTALFVSNASTACALKGATGTASCWGNNITSGLGHAAGTMGDNASHQNGTPTPIYESDQATVVTGITAIGASSVNTCLTVGTQVYCNGDSAVSLVPGPESQGAAPQIITGVSSATSVDASYFGCALLSDQHLTCWGPNTYGELARGTVPLGDAGYVIDAPAEVSGVLASQFATLSFGAVVLTTDHKVLAWGNNNVGQLGHVQGTNGDVGCNDQFTGSAGKCNPNPMPVIGLP